MSSSNVEIEIRDPKNPARFNKHNCFWNSNSLAIKIVAVITIHWPIDWNEMRSSSEYCIVTVISVSWFDFFPLKLNVVILFAHIFCVHSPLISRSISFNIFILLRNEKKIVCWLNLRFWMFDIRIIKFIRKLEMRKTNQLVFLTDSRVRPFSATQRGTANSKSHWCHTHKSQVIAWSKTKPISNSCACSSYKRNSLLWNDQMINSWNASYWCGWVPLHCERWSLFFSRNYIVPEQFAEVVVVLDRLIIMNVNKMKMIIGLLEILL